MSAATFYFDLGSPYAYLAAARVDGLFAAPVRWQPVSLGALFKLSGRSSWSLGDQEHRERGMAEVERRARGYGLPPLRWPDPWPGNYLTAMRAAVHAQSEGRLRAFVDCAYAAGFQQGQDLSVLANVLAVASEAGLDERELQRAVGEPEIKLALREATGAAHALGVFGVPTVAVGGELFWGDDRLGEAAARAATAGLDG